MVKILKNKQSLFWAGLLFAQFLLFYIFSKSEIIVQQLIAFFHFKKQFQNETFSHLKYSFGDILYIIFIFFLLFFLFKSIKSRNFRVLLIILNISYFIYQISWGMLYFQKPFYDKNKVEISSKELEKLTLKYIALTNQERKKIATKNVFKIENIEVLKSSILHSQKRLPKEYYPFETSNIDNFKASLFNPLISYTGILGYYNPFTTEAQYNSELPDTYLPFTISHENAHQLGFAREQEANFIGFLICKNSDNSELKYCAYLFVTKSLVNALRSSSPEFASQASLFLSKEVKKDLKNERMFKEKNDSLLTDFFYFTNDIFLKSNQQEGSVTYSYFIDLLVLYERKNS
ncbi:DUF3810 domain-containing protein [Cloacibacterium sp. TD35]|uniref:DUF3810 domain-containing protein n=1 Tax=Cloacibacterium sp. TD35 TaxID=2976818 RepID=UPI00237D84F0|nr:DUF3810 domain-containing protein [Cloacibacterium sp. TD35]WDT68983.1 DUF3810 domain-containing protein [Cloacibacterium sp. TD35]